MATTHGRSLGYHIPEQVSNQKLPDSRLCVLTTLLLGWVQTQARAPAQVQLWAVSEILLR